jgi:hypothetical protein
VAAGTAAAGVEADVGIVQNEVQVVLEGDGAEAVDALGDGR